MEDNAVDLSMWLDAELLAAYSRADQGTDTLLGAEIQRRGLTPPPKSEGVDWPSHPFG